MLKGSGTTLSYHQFACTLRKSHRQYALCYYMYDHSCCIGSSINLGKLMSLLGLLLAWQFAAISPTSIPLPVSLLVWLQL